MDVSYVESSAVYRLFSACQGDPVTWIIDVRGQKDFKKSHVARAFCVRQTADGRALVDYSKNQYSVKWTDCCWWGKRVLVYGDETLTRQHPVVEFLRRDGKAENVAVYKYGLEALRNEYPFLITSSVKANIYKRPYPGELVPNVLYLGDWDHASDKQQQEDLNVGFILTIHNHPENLKPVSSARHLKIEAPDVESHDISQHFPASFDFIEDARKAGKSVIVHCGAGVSRSATLCIAYLMRKNLWPMEKALAHTKACRSIVEPNEGFLNCLMALERALGISAGAAGKGFADNIAGDRVVVNVVDEKSRKDDRKRDAKSPRARGSDKAIDHSSGHHREDRHRDSRRDDRDTDHDRSQNRSTDGGRPRRERSSGRERSLEGDGGRSKRKDRADGKPSNAAESGGSLPDVALEVLKDNSVITTIEIPALKANQRCVFGRAPVCDVKLEHLSISRQHAQLTRDESGTLFITDLGTSHGTNVEDTWLRPNTAKQLRHGSLIRFGASTRSYRVAVHADDKRQRRA